MMLLSSPKPRMLDDLNELRGVLLSFTPEQPEPDDHFSSQGNSDPILPEFFHVMSSFSRPELKSEKQSYIHTLEAYFMPNVTGIYSLKARGEDLATIIVTNHRDDISSPIIKWDVSETNNMSQGEYFEACDLYFVKASVQKLGERGMSLDAVFHNTSFVKTNFGDSLFWILPGELHIDLKLENQGILETIVGSPTTITGVFETRCVVFYCGYCSLAVFMVFANHIQCTILANQTTVNTGTIEIKLIDWVLHPGDYDVKMAYRRNGNCKEIMRMKGTDVFSKSEVQLVGAVRVDPIAVVTCLFGEKICDGASKDVIEYAYNGWDRVNIAQDFSDNGFKSSSTHSMFSFGRVENTAVASLTGLCVSFRYKMSNSWNSELFVSTSGTPSGTKKRLWALSGVHGELWQTAWVHMTINERLEYFFEVSSSKANETVLISNVKVTTESCRSLVNPYYAQIGYACRKSQFRCSNGECLKPTVQCDGDAQCLDGSDELNCVCLLGQFMCVTSKECVQSRNVCDGKNHCPDGSDEQHCNFCSSKEEFYCPSGKCVLWESTCNGLSDCLDGSDEPSVCRSSKTGVTANKTCSLNDLGCLYDEQTNGADCGYFQKCNFDNGWCGWGNTGLRDTFDWLVSQEATPSEDTGPEVDHTTTSSRGSYIYIESSPPRHPGDTARLLGGPFNANQTVCLQFYYHMYGEDIGHLAVYRASSRNRSVEEIVWKHNGEIDSYWHKALVTFYEEPNEFMIVLEGSIGQGHLGDIALDDILVLRGPCVEEYHDEDVLTCSFEQPCSWNGIETWKKSSHKNVDNSSFLEGSFMYTEAPFSLTKKVSHHATIPYQCVSFWHQHTSKLCLNTSIYFSQQSSMYQWSIKVVNTRQNNEIWRFTEIPLHVTTEEYTLSLKASGDEDSLRSCLVAIDELNLKHEPCTSIKEGTSVLARIGSRFYHGVQTKYTDDSIAVYFHEPSPRFLQIYERQSVNQVVDSTPANISQLSPGTRVLVEANAGSAALGTVFGDYINELNNNTRLVNLTIRVDENGSDISIPNKTVWLLPVQLADQGPVWRNPVSDCEGQSKFNDSCYEMVKQSNWFDAIDQCKSLGGSLLTINSLEEVKFFAGNFMNRSLFWLQDLGQFSYEPVSPSAFNSRNVSHNERSESKIVSQNGTSGKRTLNLNGELESKLVSLNRTLDNKEVFLSEASKRKISQEKSRFCPAFRNGHVFAVNCSTRQYSLCEIPAQQRHIMCGEGAVVEIEETFECKEEKTLVEIHSAIIGQDEEPIYQCTSLNATVYQEPCTDFPDMTKETKLKCDGRKSCNISDSLKHVTTCETHLRYFDVIYSCQANRTKDVNKQPWCPHGYTLFESSCYKIPDVKMTWKAARAFCEADTSHFIVINNEKEDKLISSMIKSLDIGEVWIGLNDLAYEDLYQWSDGSEVGYTTWSNVNSNDHNRDCVVANETGWMVKDCGAKNKFVCEYEPSVGLCDFKTDWCGWSNEPEQNNSGWIREFLDPDRHISSNISEGDYQNVNGSISNISAIGSCDSNLDWCRWSNVSGKNRSGWINEFQEMNRSILSNISGLDGRIFLENNETEPDPYPSRVSLYQNNTSDVSYTISSLVFPWIRSTFVDSHGVCLLFFFRLTGEQSELSVVIDRKGVGKETLWKVEGLNQSLAWTQGRVSIGIVSQFRVGLTGKLFDNDSMISIASILFKPGFCQALPHGSQDLDTHISINSSGILTSPYYPSFYVNGMSRRWRLKTSKAQQIRLKFLNINIERDPGCKKDFIMLQDGENSENKFYFCGNTLPSDFTSTSNQLEIVFKTNHRITHTGFKIRYSVVKENEEDVCLFADIPDCPDNCRCYRWLSDQSKITVYGKGLFNIPSLYPQFTSAIYYEKSSFYKITDADFKNLPYVEFLSLNENLISLIERGAFRSLNSLKTIRMAQNTITNFPFFTENTTLEVIDLSGNWIQSLEPQQLSLLRKLRTLSLRFNKLASLKDGTFSGLQNLKFLYLDNNEITKMEVNVFNETTGLEVLHLQGNKLQRVKKKWFQELRLLQKLRLNNNNIEVIEAGSFDKLQKLSELDLSGNQIHDFSVDLFTSLSSLRLLKVDHFTLCCYAEKSLPSVSCSSVQNNGISSCDELLKNSVLKYSIWVFGVLAFAGNLGVIIWRLIGKDKNKVNSFLLTNLAVSDFLMGVYMLIIAYKDRLWDGEYFEHDISWRASELCIFAGVISTISSEVSVFTLSLITFDRVICIVFPFKFRRMSMKRAVYLTTFVWILGIVLSIIPLLNDDYFYDFHQRTHFYGRSPVCLPFELSSEKSPGWEFSAFVFSRSMALHLSSSSQPILLCTAQ